MKRARLKKFFTHMLTALVLTSALSMSKPAFALKDEVGAMLFFGEALGISNFRVNFKSFDLGLDARSFGVYGGPHLWLGQVYTGSGLYIGNGDGGVYGHVGYQGKLFGLPILRFAGEFFGIGTVMGKTYGGLSIGIGVGF